MRTHVFCLVLFFAAFSSALSVNLLLPADSAYVSSLSVNFSFSVDGNASSCALYSNASGWGIVANSSNVSSFSHSFSSDGVYSWAVACSGDNQTVFSPSNRTVHVDTVVPGIPGNLTSSGNTPAVLSWAAPVDSSFLVYDVFRNGTLIASNVSYLNYSENVPASTTHNYSVRAVDAAGWASPLASVLVQGPAASMIISNLSVSATSSTAIFSWATNIAANASVSYGNGASVLGIVSNPSLSNSASLSIAGLSPATTYAYNATACAAACANVSGTFRTLASSYPVPSQIGANGSVASTNVRFSAFWSDSLNLSYYVFSTNLSGSWANASFAFNGSSYSNHSFVLPATSVTIYWLFYANNSQGGLNQTPLQSLTVAVPAVVTVTPTPVPTVLPTATLPAATVVPTTAPTTAPPTPTLVPTVTPTTTPSPTPTAVPVLNASGKMSGLILDALQANFSLSPTGLVIGVSERQATVILSSNFTNTGSENVTVILRAFVLAADLNSSSSEFELRSQPLLVPANQTSFIQTTPALLPSGEYELVGQVLSAESGQVLDSQILKIRVTSYYAANATASSSPALAGFIVVILAVGALVAGQLNAVRNEFG